MEGSPPASASTQTDVTVDPTVQTDPTVDPAANQPASSDPAAPASNAPDVPAANQPQAPATPDQPAPGGATSDAAPAPAVDPETLHPTAVSPQQNPQGDGELPVNPGTLATPSEQAAPAAVAAPPVPVGGRVDNVTSRNAGDALQGGFVEIDIEHDSVPQNVRDYNGDPRYGVFLEPVTVGDDGYPELCLVKLRDSNAQIVVGYEALSPSDAGRR